MKHYIPALFIGIFILAGIGTYAVTRPCEGGSCDPAKPVTLLEDRSTGEEHQETTSTPSEEQGSPGSYEAYAPEKLAKAEEGDIVLFFHASWCPSCRFLDAEIRAHADEIPSGLAILKLDYDTEIELKKKYGVTTQHTLVQVDAEGNLIKKWSGGISIESIVAQLK